MAGAATGEVRLELAGLAGLAGSAEPGVEVVADREPRLAPESIVASRDETVDATELKVRFVGRAELVCEPVNVPVEFIADVELESASIQINRL